MPTLPHASAERLRAAFSRIQSDVFAAEDIPETTKCRLIEDISASGFLLIDELEGVVR